MSNIITAEDVYNRYLEIGKAVGSVELDAGFMIPAEQQITSDLASKFTVPFSSNNLTAKDLMIDETYYRYMLTKQAKKAGEMRKSLDSRIEKLLSGASSMVTDSGDILSREQTVAWSSTMNYTPVFGLGEIEDFEPDPDQIDDEEDARD